MLLKLLIVLLTKALSTPELHVALIQVAEDLAKRTASPVDDTLVGLVKAAVMAPTRPAAPDQAHRP